MFSMFGFSSPVTYATTKLSYPIFDAEFDPYNRGYLVVAGGGGENRTGVPNKITLLDVSSRSSVTEVADISLSTDEDSPQSLASLTTKKGLITFAGISSSVADQKSGINEHFRSYDIEFPLRKRAKRDEDTPGSAKEKGSEARISLAGRSSLFQTPTAAKSKVYQRLLRLSPVTSRDTATKRIGAIAAADAAANEIVVFDATTFIPNASSILARIRTSTETEDLDLLERSEGSFILAYCTDCDIFVQSITCNFSAKTSKLASESPDPAFSVPRYGSKRPKIRSLRWLNPHHLMFLQNLSPGGGPEIVTVRIAADGKGSVVQRYRLPQTIGIAMRLDICCLDADPVTGKRQIVVAVAGQDRSIHIFTCNHEPARKDISRHISRLSLFSVLDTSDQHPQSISKIRFSNFFVPHQAENSTVTVASETQYLHLASVSLGYTVSVEALALTTVTTSPSSTPDVSTKRKTPSVRWVLATSRSEVLKSWSGIILMVVLFTGILLSYYMKHTVQLNRRAAFQATDVIGAEDIIPATRSITSDAAGVVSPLPEAADGASRDSLYLLRDLLYSEHPEQVRSNEDGFKAAKKAIHVRPDYGNPNSNDVSASLHEDVDKLKAQGAKRFEELEEHEKEAWKKRLSAAGQWSVEEGETVLKGVFFSQFAEIVGGAIRDAVLQP